MRISLGLAIVLSLGAPGCADDESSASCAGVSLARPVLVLESNQVTASGLGRIGTDGCLTEISDLALGAEPLLAEAHGRPFVLVRDQGVVHEIDRSELRVARTVSVSTDGEPEPNPWDVDVDAQGRLWVARYDLASVAIVAPDGSIEDTVDLTPWAGTDGIPDMSAIRVVGDTAYVVLERLLNDDTHIYTQTGPGLVVAIETAEGHAVHGPFDLAGENPFPRLGAVPHGRDDEVLVVLPGAHESADPGDGIARVQLEAGTSALIASELDLGGSALEVVMASETEAYAIVEGPVPDTNPTRVVQFDPSTGKVTRTLAEASAFVHAGLALDGDEHLLVGDHTPGAARIRIFARESGKEVGTLSPRRLPPWSMLAL